MQGNMMIVVCYALFYLISGLRGLSAEANGQNDIMDVFRLPTHSVPISYKLDIRPDYDNANNSVNFDGEVEIIISVKNETSEITLNYRDLHIDVVYVNENLTKQDIDVTDIQYNNNNEQFTIYLESELRVGVEYKINIEFHSKIENSMNGIYNSTYQDPQGNKERLLFTYFEPTGARRIFPCYDEPEYRTPYIITVTRPKSKTSQSNMPVSMTYFDKTVSMTRDIFEETPPIATHQVALIVSQFESNTESGVGKNGVVHGYTHVDYLDQIKYISIEAPGMLAAMENFTDMKYALPKLDLFAVPDFKSDAMGNWGLTTYREKYLLLNEVSSAKAHEVGISIAQREIARQWFGNLITCSWWDYLWLHDAFTTYFQYFITHELHPDWRMNHVFVVEAHQSAMVYDQMPRRPITASLKTPAQINDAFYDQTFKKAAAFLRMLKYATTETIFKQSLIRYLKQNEYKSVEPDVLFTAFESTVSEYKYDFGQGVTVTSFMREWTENAGYPVINVEKKNNTFIITQERFLIDTPDQITDHFKWSVGITYTTESSKNFDDLRPVAWCSPPMEKCVSVAPQDPGWFIFNLQSTGFYRVNYDRSNWNLLIGQLKHNHAEMNVLNRAQMIDDSFNLARADKLHYSIPLKLACYLKSEDDVIPWYSAINGYAYLLERMRRNYTEYSQLREHVSELAKIIYTKIEDRVVVQNNSDHIILTSWNAFSVWACGLNNTNCQQSAFEYYRKWQKEKKIPSDIRDVAFCIGIRLSSDNSTWEQMLDLYMTTKSPSEKQSAQMALACTENKLLLSRYLNYIFYHDGGPIKNQDFKDIFIAISLTSTGLDVLIDFLANNLDRIIKEFVDGDDIATFIYSLCASKVALDDEIKRIECIKDDTNTPERLRKVFDEEYKIVKYNMFWYDQYHDIVRQNIECSTEYTTTEIPFEPTYTTPYTNTPSSTMNSTISSVSETTKSESTELPTTNTTLSEPRQTTHQESTESSTLYTTSTKQLETTPFINTTSSIMNSTATSILDTTPYPVTVLSTMSSTISSVSETTKSESTELPTKNITSSEPRRTTHQESTESSTLYTTSTRQIETTTYIDTTSSIMNSTTSSSLDTTSYPVTVLSTTNSTISSVSETTKSESTELPIINTTSSEQQLTTHQEPIKSSTFYTMSTFKSVTTEAISIKPIPINTTSSVPPETTISTPDPVVSSIFTVTSTMNPLTQSSSSIFDKTTIASDPLSTPKPYYENLYYLCYFIILCFIIFSTIITFSFHCFSLSS